MHLNLKQKAIISLSIVALCYSIFLVVVRLMNAGFGPFTQVYLRLGLGCLLTAGIFYRKIHFKKFINISKRDWFLLLLVGTVGYGLAVDLLTLGILHTKLLNVAVIGSTTPFFVFLISIIIFRKSFRYYLLLFLVIAFYGVCVLATNSWVPTFAQYGIGDLFVLLSAIGFGVLILGRKMLSSFLNNYEIALIILIFAFISSFIVAIILREPLSFAGFSNPIALFGLFLGGVLNLITIMLETFAFKNINAVAGSQLLLLENVFAPIFGYIFYQEYILPIEFFGALLVVAGVWLYIKYGED